MSQPDVSPPARGRLRWHILMSRRWHGLLARRWHDGDTTLLFAVFVVIVLGLLAWRVTDASNWILLPQSQAAEITQDCGQGSE